jgi:hypothetical protein
MHVRTVIFLLVVSMAGAGLAAAEELAIGAPMPSSAMGVGADVMVGPGQTLPAYTIRHGKHDYIVCPDGENRMVYISPQSRRFATEEGVRIGDSFKKVRELADGAVQKHPGWAFVVSLPSGWNAAFTQGADMTDGELKEKTRVAFIFKSVDGG